MLHVDISTTTKMRVHNLVKNCIYVAYFKYVCILIMGFEKVLWFKILTFFVTICSWDKY